MKLLFFDLETTGIKYWRNGIHQISGEIVIDGVTKESFNFNVCPHPQCEIEEEALRICNVSKEQIQAYPSMREVYVKFVNMLSKYVDKFDKKDKFFLVGYNNAAFDNHFLKAFFVQNGDNYFYSWFWVNSIDVMVLSTQHFQRLVYRDIPRSNAERSKALVHYRLYLDFVLYQHDRNDQRSDRYFLARSLRQNLGSRYQYH